MFRINPTLLTLTVFAVGPLTIPPGRAVAQPSPLPAPVPSSTPRLPVVLPTPTLDVLPNGLRVIVVERRSAPLVALDLRIKAGTAYETVENNGVAHFLEHLLFKGTPTRKPGEVDAAIEAIGGEFSANTSMDWAQFAATVPASAWHTALEVLADAVQNPAIRAEDLEVERRVILDEMASAENDPTRAPFHALSSVAFENHPYRLSLYGPEENVRRLTREDVLAFWRARYTPGNMTLVLVGDVQRGDVVNKVRALFTAPASPAAAAAAASLPDPTPLTERVRARPLQRDRSLVTVTLGFRAPSVKAVADSVALDVLLQILTGGGRGRLNESLVRDKKVALAVSASYLTQRAPGLLILTAVGPRGDPQVLEEALLAEVRRLLEDGVSDAEVERARRAALGQTLFQEETFSGQANALAFYDAIDTYEYSVRYAEQIAAVTSQDVKRVIRTYLTPERYAAAVMMPRAPTPPSVPGREASR